jgi:hypothetical protein
LNATEIQCDCSELRLPRCGLCPPKPQIGDVYKDESQQWGITWTVFARLSTGALSLRNGNLMIQRSEAYLADPQNGWRKL